MKLKNIFQTSLLFTLLVVSGCGQNDDAKSLDFGINPKQPQVINADFSANKPVDPADPLAAPEKDVIVGPWVYVQPYFKNNSAGYMTIQTVKFIFRGSSIVDGTDVLKEYTLDAGLLPNNTDTATDNDTFFFAELAPGAEFQLPSVRWYLASLPDLKTVSSLNFRITAEAIGWFGDRNTPTKTLSKKIFLNTAQ